MHEQGLCEVVTDKGYHSGVGLAEMSESVRTYVSVPQQPRRNWEGKAEQQAAVYGNRRRVEGQRGKSLLRRRGELLERPFAHQYETGAMRRLHVRGRGNVAKRVLLQAAAFQSRADSAIDHESRNAQRPGGLENEDRFGFIASSGCSFGAQRAAHGTREIFSDHPLPAANLQSSAPKFSRTRNLEVLTRAPNCQ